MYLDGGFKREKASVEKPGKASRQALGAETNFQEAFSSSSSIH
jgi:hypothetical protein